jgi:uncharacterized protein YciI
MKARRRLAALALALLPPAALAQAPAPAASAAAPPGRLFAVEIRTGPAWAADKPPPQQAYFREHSAHLRRLRDQGLLVLGARYGDKGLVVLAAENEAAARALVEQDPSMQHGTFRYELHEFGVFYGGSVQAAPRRP